MQMALVRKRMEGWLVPALLILFLLEILLLPLTVDIAYAGRSENPSHVLTYTKGKLIWDSATGISKDGTAEVSLFASQYDGTVQSKNKSTVVAPGTEKNTIVRFKNEVSGSVQYRAVLYQMKDDQKLPVEAVLSGDQFQDTDQYTLPAGVSKSQVLRAVTGTVAGGQIQDFDLEWKWEFEDMQNLEGRDSTDTSLGNANPLSEVKVGLYLVVEDENSYGSSSSYVTPTSPKTGDDSPIGLYVGLMAVSGAVLLLLLLERRWERNCESN